MPNMMIFFEGHPATGSWKVAFAGLTQVIPGTPDAGSQIVENLASKMVLSGNDATAYASANIGMDARDWQTWFSNSDGLDFGGAEIFAASDYGGTVLWDVIEEAGTALAECF